MVCGLLTACIDGIVVYRLGSGYLMCFLNQQIDFQNLNKKVVLLQSLHENKSHMGQCLPNRRFCIAQKYGPHILSNKLVDCMYV